MTKNKHQVLAISAIVAIFFGLSMLPAYAVTTITNDQWYSFGQKYWGHKGDGYNDYSGTLGKYYFCRDNNGNAKAGCPTLIDTRTNYVRLAANMNSSVTSAFETTIEGCVFGYCDNPNGGAANTNYGTGKIFPRSPIAPTGFDYYLDSQYAWFDDTQFSDSKPNSGASNHSINSTLLTDLWFQDTVSGNTNNYLVIDFYDANLWNENGHWKEMSQATGGVAGHPFVDYPNSHCVYHYSDVIDNQPNTIVNTWRQAPTTDIAPIVTSAFHYTTYSDLSGGHCTTSVPNSSGTTYGTNWNMVDQETGVEVFDSSTGTSKTGTIVGAFSESLLEYK